MVRDYLDRALLDLATLYRDVLMVQSGSVENLINQNMENEITKIASSTTESKTLLKIRAILRARVNLSHSSATLLTVESLMLELKD